MAIIETYGMDESLNRLISIDASTERDPLEYLNVSTYSPSGKKFGGIFKDLVFKTAPDQFNGKLALESFNVHDHKNTSVSLVFAGSEYFVLRAMPVGIDPTMSPLL